MLVAWNLNRLESIALCETRVLRDTVHCGCCIFLVWPYIHTYRQLDPTRKTSYY
jgi:hypothetical protein